MLKSLEVQVRAVFDLVRQTLQLATILSVFLVGVFGCSNLDEEGGVIGTGIIFGTVSVNKQLAAETVEFKSGTGEKFSAVLNRNRRFAANDAAGVAPYLMRSNLGNGDYHYAIAFQTGTTHNINSYSDLIVRNWFAANNLNPDDEFASAQAFSLLPTEQELDTFAQQLFSITRLALESYNVTGPELLTATYNADDQGIDEYLKKNPIVIDDLALSLVLTDQITEIQSTTLLGLSLGTTLLFDSTSGPTTVENVRAIGSTTDEIVVFWDTAVDNIGVIGYQVFRDGALLATTPYPVYVDNSNLLSGSSYSYTIVAIDSDGNLSVSSEPVTGSTLATADTTAPPAPINLAQTNVSANQISLRWDQSSIPDVVAFNVSRGAPGEEPQSLIRTTATFVTDRSVSGGTNYCYVVQAIDAAGNASDRSEVLCASTEGTAVVITQNIAELTIPDTNSMSCTAILPAEFTSNATLDQPCYLVNSTSRILGGSDVFVPAGTVFKFAEGVGLDVTANAGFFVLGTQENPVVFTGREESVGFWRGITLDETFNSSQIRNAVIQYAGSSPGSSAITIRSPAVVNLEGSLIHQNAGPGLIIDGDRSRIDAFEGNTITENGSPADIALTALSQFSSNNDFTGNIEDKINIPLSSITESLVVPDLGVPILSNGLAVSRGATLTIDAGVELVFKPGSAIYIDQSTLNVTGTASNLVTFTSTEKTPGSWGGVHMTSAIDSVLQGTVIEYGGQTVATHDANLSLVDSFATISNLTLQQSSAYGIFVENSEIVGDDPRLLNNVLEQ